MYHPLNFIYRINVLPMMMISLKRITKNVMETDKKKNSGRKATRGSVRDARETFERRLCCSLLVRSQIPDEWKLGKLENSRTTGNSLLGRPQGFACAAERGKLPEKHTSHNRKNDGYQSMDRKRPENRDSAKHWGPRLNVRDTFSQ